MNAEQILKTLQPWIRQHQRTTWVPQVEEGSDGGPKGSRFGGSPWVPQGAEAPACRHCEEPLRMLLQLNLETLPAEARGKLPAKGLLQAFYCQDPDCEQEEDGWSPFSGAHHVRTVDASGAGAVAEYGEPFPPRAITGWAAEPDLPAAAEHDTLGLEFDYDFKAKTMRIRCPLVRLESPSIPMDDLEEEQIANAAAGDKLRGWPLWIQGVEYPQCPTCSRYMEHVFQIDSEKNVPYMWGDLGIAHVTQCPEHPEVLTMAWACS